MRAALRVCPEEGGVETSGGLVPILLAFQDEVAAPGGPDAADPIDPEHRMFREIVRSQAFYMTWDKRSRMGHFEVRWRDLPAREGLVGPNNPADAFEFATAASFDDFMGVGTAFWAGSISQPGRVVGFPPGIAWDETRRERTMRLMTSRVAELRGSVSALVGDREAYAFDEFRRRPILRLADNEYLVLAPDLLFERLFGTAPLLDIKSALEGQEPERRWPQIKRISEKMCELDALDALRRISAAGQFTFYSEGALQAAYGAHGVQIAEAAIDVGDEWIVVEVSSRRLTRPTVVDADARALREDIDRGIRQKFDQVNSIVDCLVNDEAKLTGAEPKARSRYTRVLVAYDGFPVNPLTYGAIQRAAPPSREDRRISVAHVISAEELDLVESLAELGGRSMPALLLGHERASLFRSALKDFILLELRLEPAHPARILAGSQRVWAPAFRAFGVERDERT